MRRTAAALLALAALAVTQPACASGDGGLGTAATASRFRVLVFS